MAPDPLADPEPTPPPPPDDDACCGNGCEPCIYDLYEAERERYFAALKAWRERQR
ncbi:MAG TPA: oxidoreductase-like domain-containing protein [Albitalea sp.]|nr:oxidoreductase-like domain-containing protein [Albitalea sp.]